MSSGWDELWRKAGRKTVSADINGRVEAVIVNDVVWAKLHN